ncbi:MAG: hypothetical protein SFW65_03600 [Alphaproteobacteria bacterium]|nr:hypothetical protein [Alphaproteobacteria bacterium]
MRDFDEHNPRLRIIFGLVTLLVLIGAVWLAAGFIWPEDNGQIAILKADNTPYKVKPDQPGGMQIPHQDKLIFNTVSSDGKMVTVERILPGPETPLNTQAPAQEIPVPVSSPDTKSEKPAEKADTKADIKPETKQEEKTAPLPTPTAAGKTVDAPVPVAAMGRVVEAAPDAVKAPSQPAKPPAAFDMSKGEPQPLVKPTPVPEADIEEEAQGAEPAVKEPTVKEPFVKETAQADDEPVVDTSGPKSKARVKDTAAIDAQDDSDATPEPKKEAAGGKAHFQLASFFDKPSADKGLAQFKSKFAGELQGASLGIASATINGGKQVFRIQGSAASTATASDICSNIKAKGGTCVIIKQ